MVPISAIAIVCLALYKADADAVSESGEASDVSSGRGQATKMAAVAFLRYVGCGALVQGSDNSTVQETVVLLHQKYIGAALVASFSYVAILGLRILCYDFEVDSGRMRDMRSNARMAFGLAVGLLIFAVVGFQPLIFTSIASAVSLGASIVMINSAVDAPDRAVEEEEALRGQGHGPLIHFMKSMALRTQLQAHALSVVTLCCLYCLGCMLVERMALSGDRKSAVKQEEVRLQFVGFQLAFAAAAWFSITLAVRASWKTFDVTRADR